MSATPMMTPMMTPQHPMTTPAGHPTPSYNPTPRQPHTPAWPAVHRTSPMQTGDSTPLFDER